MRKKTIILFFITALFMMSLIYIAEAKETGISGSLSKAFGFISDILNAKVRLPNTGYLPSYHRNQTISLGVFAGVFIIIYSIIFTVTRRIPMFKEEGAKNAAIGFSIAFTLISILASPIVELVANMVAVTGELGAVALFVIALVVIAGLFALTPKAWRWTRGEEREVEEEKEIEKEEREEGKEKKKKDKEEEEEKEEDKIRRVRIELDKEIYELLKQIIDLLKDLPKDKILGREYIEVIIKIIDEAIRKLEEKLKLHLDKLELQIEKIIKESEKEIKKILEEQGNKISDIEGTTKKIIEKLIEQELYLERVKESILKALEKTELGIDKATGSIIKQLDEIRKEIKNINVGNIEITLINIIKEIEGIDVLERRALEYIRKIIWETEEIKKIIIEIYKQLGGEEKQKKGEEQIKVIFEGEIKSVCIELNRCLGKAYGKRAAGRMELSSNIYNSITSIIRKGEIIKNKKILVGLINEVQRWLKTQIIPNMKELQKKNKLKEIPKLIATVEDGCRKILIAIGRI